MQKEIYLDANEVASKAAEDAIATLDKAIHEKGRASWVLAGGSSPMVAYQIIANMYADAIDWSKVTILIGDERCVPLIDNDSNWGQISKILFANEVIANSKQLVPRAELGAEAGAKHYSQQIRDNLTDENGELSFDLLWLGVGEDGHTLSLFPEHVGLNTSADIIIPVHDSPKPPSDRITLSLDSAAKSKKVVIFAVGANKTEVLARVQKNPHSLPVGLLAVAADIAGAEVLWLYDTAANS